MCASSQPAAIDDDVAAAVAYLRTPEGGEPERLYTVGFCLGGRVSLLQAAAGVGLAGVIGLYPWPTGPHRSGLPAPADEAPRFGCPVLALYGEADAGIPAEARDAFDHALDAAGVEHRSGRLPGRAALLLRPQGRRLRRCDRRRLARDADLHERRMIDFSLTDAQREVQRTARAFAEREILPRIRSWTRTRPTTAPCTRRWAPRACSGLPIPERYGGAGMDYIAFALLCEEMERADTAFRVILRVHTGLNSLTLLQWGTEEQKQQLPRPAGARREARDVRPHRAGRRLRRRQPGHHRAPRRRSVHPQRLEDLDQPGRHGRPLPRLRQRRPDEGPQGHHRLHRRARLPRLQLRLAARQARRAGRQHRHPQLQRLRGAGRQPGRRGGRGLQDRHERDRPGPLHGRGRLGRPGLRRASTHRSSTRTSARPSARRSASTSSSSR